MKLTDEPHDGLNTYGRRSRHDSCFTHRIVHLIPLHITIAHFTSECLIAVDVCELKLSSEARISAVSVTLSCLSLISVHSAPVSPHPTCILQLPRYFRLLLLGPSAILWDAQYL